MDFIRDLSSWPLGGVVVLLEAEGSHQGIWALLWKAVIRAGSRAPTPSCGTEKQGSAGGTVQWGCGHREEGAMGMGQQPAVLPLRHV